MNEKETGLIAKRFSDYKPRGETQDDWTKNFQDDVRAEITNLEEYRKALGGSAGDTDQQGASGSSASSETSTGGDSGNPSNDSVKNTKDYGTRMLKGMVTKANADTDPSKQADA